MLRQKLTVLLISGLLTTNTSFTTITGEVELSNVGAKKVEGEVIDIDLRLGLKQLLEEPEIEEENAQEVVCDRVEEQPVEVEEEVLEYAEPVYLPPHFNPYNLLEPSNVSREQMYDILEGTALQTLSNGYVYMEEVYGINALFLVAISAYESGWGTSYLAMNNNNLGGIKASDGSWAYFSDWFECISYKADLLYHQYLIPTGAYYNGTSTCNINVRYCEESVWADNINAIAYELLSKIE